MDVGALAKAAGGQQVGRAGGPGCWSECGGAWPCGGPLPSPFRGPLREGRGEEHCSVLSQSTGLFSVEEAAPSAKMVLAQILKKNDLCNLTQRVPPLFLKDLNPWAGFTPTWQCFNCQDTASLRKIRLGDSRPPEIPLPTAGAPPLSSKTKKPDVVGSMPPASSVPRSRQAPRAPA